MKAKLKCLKFINTVCYLKPCITITFVNELQ